jgi:hypothetical protein
VAAGIGSTGSQGTAGAPGESRRSRPRRRVQSRRRVPLTNAEIRAYNLGHRLAHLPEADSIGDLAHARMIPAHYLKPEDHKARQDLGPETWWREGWSMANLRDDDGP